MDKTKKDSHLIENLKDAANKMNKYCLSNPEPDAFNIAEFQGLFRNYYEVFGELNKSLTMKEIVNIMNESFEKNFTKQEIEHLRLITTAYSETLKEPEQN